MTFCYNQMRETLSQRRRRLVGRRETSGDRRASTTFMNINPFFYIADDEAALLGDPTETDSLPISEAEAAAFAEVLADC